MQKPVIYGGHGNRCTSACCDHWHHNAQGCWRGKASRIEFTTSRWFIRFMEAQWPPQQLRCDICQYGKLPRAASFEYRNLSKIYGAYGLNRKTHHPLQLVYPHPSKALKRVKGLICLLEMTLAVWVGGPRSEAPISPGMGCRHAISSGTMDPSSHRFGHLTVCKIQVATFKRDYLTPIVGFLELKIPSPSFSDQ